jgi:putative methyltransferase
MALERDMNFYFDAANTLDQLDARQGSIKGIIATLPEKTRKRTGALIIETLKCMLPALTICQCKAEMQLLR